MFSCSAAHTRSIHYIHNGLLAIFVPLGYMT